MASVHPTAVIEDGASLGQDVEIGPYCVVGGQVTLGDGVRLHSHVVVGGRTSVGMTVVAGPAGTAESLLRAADASMYEDKQRSADRTPLG